MAYFKVLSQHSSGETEENLEKFQSSSCFRQFQSPKLRAGSKVTSYELSDLGSIPGRGTEFSVCHLVL
jgi:hypothetical protein